jgi:predicted aconitase with swiveling domain
MGRRQSPADRFLSLPPTDRVGWGFAAAAAVVALAAGFGLAVAVLGGVDPDTADSYRLMGSRPPVTGVERAGRVLALLAAVAGLAVGPGSALWLAARGVKDVPARVGAVAGGIALAFALLCTWLAYLRH